MLKVYQSAIRTTSSTVCARSTDRSMEPASGTELAPTATPVSRRSRIRRFPDGTMDRTRPIPPWNPAAAANIGGKGSPWNDNEASWALTGDRQMRTLGGATENGRRACEYCTGIGISCRNVWGWNEQQEWRGGRLFRTPHFPSSHGAWF